MRQLCHIFSITPMRKVVYWLFSLCTKGTLFSGQDEVTHRSVQTKWEEGESDRVGAVVNPALSKGEKAGILGYVKGQCKTSSSEFNKCGKRILKVRWLGTRTQFPCSTYPLSSPLFPKSPWAVLFHFSLTKSCVNNWQRKAKEKFVPAPPSFHYNKHPSTKPPRINKMAAFPTHLY